jgi:transglutaminase-like putative cysteine protease
MPVGKPPLWQAARTAGWMALMGAPVMALLFVLFPRVGPLWGILGDASAARTGLSATMRVGSVTTLALDDSIAMRLQFDGPPPAVHELYFRGPVLGGFDGREWRPIEPWQRSAFNLPSAVQVQGTPVRYTVTLEPSHRPWVTLLEAVPTAPDIPGYELQATADLQWLSTRPVTDIVRFTATSYPAFRHGPLQRLPGLQAYVDLPAGFNPRTLQWATELRRDPRHTSTDTAGWVQLALDQLRTGGYGYTLEPGEYGMHSADELWFDRKEGFCEHFAASFVVLMRALDIPARVVTGYQGGERNPVDGFWVVRNSDAHAWTEVWHAGLGWVRVDPTGAVSPARVGSLQRLSAPRGLVASALGSLSPNLAAQLRAGWDAVNNSWNQWVLNYSKGRQLDLLKNLGFASPSWADLGYLIAALLVAASLLGAALTLWERRQHDPWLRLLGHVRRRLAQSGLVLPAHSPPRQMAHGVMAHFGPPGQAVHDWLLQFERHRYGTTLTTASRGQPSPVRQLRHELQRLPWPTA